MLNKELISGLQQEFNAKSKIFTILAPGGHANGFNKPENLSRVTEHFEQLGLHAEFVRAKNGLPAQDAYGAYTLVTHDEKAEKQAPRILDAHYGLVCIPG